MSVNHSHINYDELGKQSVIEREKEGEVKCVLMRVGVCGYWQQPLEKKKGFDLHIYDVIKCLTYWGNNSETILNDNSDSSLRKLHFIIISSYIEKKFYEYYIITFLTKNRQKHQLGYTPLYTSSADELWYMEKQACPEMELHLYLDKSE